MEGTRINKKVEVRLEQDAGGYYTGYIMKDEVLIDKDNDKKSTILLNKVLDDGWNKVTGKCVTKAGCKYAVKNWLKEHTIIELEMEL